MPSTSSYLVIALAFSLPLYAYAVPIDIRADPEDSEDTGDVPDGHLTPSWVVAVAVSLVVIISALVGVVFFAKRRQRRRARRSQPYRGTVDKLVSPHEQAHDRAWHGPYVSRASYARPPSPPTAAHVSEKDKWTSPHR